MSIGVSNLPEAVRGIPHEGPNQVLAQIKVSLEPPRFQIPLKFPKITSISSFVFHQF